MSTILPPDVARLRVALEEHMDAMSSSAQMVLEGLTHATPPATELQHRDVDRIHKSACEAYQMVHERLTVAHFDQCEQSQEDELHSIRHDLRGPLNTVILRGGMMLEDGDELPHTTRKDLTMILDRARACVEVLNQQRDAAVELDVVPHLLHTSGQGLVGDSLIDNPRSPSFLIAGARILVADDSAASRETLGLFLERQGHTVGYACDGREALLEATRQEYDLVLLDLVMPELNGFQVLEALRTQGILRHTSVILVSGMDAQENAVRGIELGADDYLTRPVDLKLLRARVNACVERQRLRERELAQYFTPDLARYLLRHPEELSTGQQRQVTVLFCDIVGFSAVSERIGPELTIRWVGAVLSAMSDCVMAVHGVLVDYTGDQLMALWGAPRRQDDHADLACRCAQAMMAALPGLDERWRDIVGQPTEVSIGINTGEAYTGNIGTPQKFKYGALGNTVNLASRVQSASKYVHSSVLITGDTLRRLVQTFACRRLGFVQVNNIEKPVELIELSGRTFEGMEELYRSYENALTCFETGEFRTASAQLGALLLHYPHDGPSLLLMSRVVEALLQQQRQEGFDPVWKLPGK